ncbi:cytochrome b [Salinicola sp. NYA28a]
MAMTDSRERYGAISRLLHWATALLVTLQLTSVYMSRWQPGNWLSQYVQPWHMTIGVTVLALVVVRLLWLCRQMRHRPPHQSKAALLGHVFLYVVLLMVPLSGLLQGYGVQLFGHLVTKGLDTPLAEAAQALHGLFAYVLTALVMGHVFMVLFHHLIRRDGTLKRMVGKANT